MKNEKKLPTLVIYYKVIMGTIFFYIWLDIMKIRTIDYFFYIFKNPTPGQK